MKISVVIPTYKRPEMLRSTLWSVSQQSRLDLIAEVIVSENSDDERSKAVCAEFSQLPLRHRYQAIPVHSGAHFAHAAAEASCEWIAMLGDDDSWGRYHLEEAHRCLTQQPGAVAYCAQAGIVQNSSRQIHSGFTRLLHAYIHPECSCDDGFWTWGRKEMLVECLLATPLNLWGLVARKQPLLSAFECMAADLHGMDSDRMFMWRLTRTGNVLAGREATLFYRSHPGNIYRQMIKADAEHQQRMSRLYTEEMIREARENGLDPVALWADLWARMPPAAQKKVLEHALPGTIESLCENLGSSALGGTVWKGKDKPSLKDLLKGCLPPFLTRLLVKLCRQLTRT